MFELVNYNRWQSQWIIFILNVPVNNFLKVMSGRVFLGWTSTKQQIDCPDHGHNTVTPPVVRLEPANLDSLPREPLLYIIWSLSLQLRWAKTQDLSCKVKKLVSFWTNRYDIYLGINAGVVDKYGRTCSNQLPTRTMVVLETNFGFCYKNIGMLLTWLYT